MNIHKTAVAALAAAFAFGTAPAYAAGMTSHAAMADFGREALPDSPLKALLTRHRPSMLAGAIHPDGGYGSGSAFPPDREMAERAHWGDFTLAFVRYLRQNGCAAHARELTRLAPVLPQTTGLIDPAVAEACEKLIAFAWGNAAHGLTDETWDSLFEPVVRERGEDPNPALFLDANRLWGPFTPGTVLRTLIGASNYQALTSVFAATPMNAIEYAMDVMLIHDRGIWLDAPTLQLPPANDLVEVFRLNRPNQGVTATMIQRAQVVARGAVQAERLGAATEQVRIRSQMPWAAANYWATSGGIVDGGYMVSTMYRQMWNRLIGDEPFEAPFVAGVHPRHGATDVPTRRDAAGLRIHAFFGASMEPASIEAPGAFKLLGPGGGIIAGQVHAGIYQRDFTHTMKFFPTADLQPGKTYTAVLTTAIRDERGAALPREFRWSFTTAK
jgi:hypothetical protein